MSSDFGTYRLVFEAPTDQITPGVEMTLPGEASLDQMLTFFEAFLRASGYYFDGDLQIVEQEQDGGIFSMTARGSQGVDFVPFKSYGDTVLFGGSGTDTISFGEPRAAMEFGAKTWDDVISFG